MAGECRLGAECYRHARSIVSKGLDVDHRIHAKRKLRLNSLVLDHNVNNGISFFSVMLLLH